jgi:hypothetical protein
MQHRLSRFIKEFAADVQKGRFVRTLSGIILDKGVKLEGLYTHGVNGQDFVQECNLVPDAAILAILNTFYGSRSKDAAFYLAPFTGSSSPAAGWTAANFTANATENTSTSEGYSEVTRQAATFGSAASGEIDSYSSLASFSIVTASTVTFTGLGLLTSNTRGGTSGLLASAIKFGTGRALVNGDTFQAGYKATLTD